MNPRAAAAPNPAAAANPAAAPNPRATSALKRASRGVVGSLTGFALFACASEDSVSSVGASAQGSPSQGSASAATDGAATLPSASASSDPGSGGPALLGAPLVFAPTASGFGVSVALELGAPEDLGLAVRAQGAETWGAVRASEKRADDLAEWRLSDLEPGSVYEYRVSALSNAEELFVGRAVTTRGAGSSFSFALITDSHIGPDLAYSNQGDPAVLSAVSGEIEAFTPDFIVNLGDMLDFHQYGFNAPPPDGSVTRSAYLNYRSALGASTAHSSHFGVIGNWEGENGDFSPEAIQWSREQRVLYLPNPNPETYPQGGSPFEDYYAFTWGDALFVVLNVMTYTPTSHLLSSSGGQPEDWTLGPAQLEWLEATLEGASSKWRFVLIHHAVGGAAGDPANSAYGRGGGQAAYVGEQAIVHQLMRDHGVQIFFYGHDHVFTDMVVDGIHYTMPGSAGAPWMFGQAETGYEQSWQVSGWAKVEVTPSSVDVQFIEMGGTPIYQYQLEQ